MPTTYLRFMCANRVLDKFLTKCSVPYSGDCHLTVFFILS